MTSSGALVLITILVLHISTSNGRFNKYCPAEEEEPWSYHGSNGPRFWGLTFPLCSGKMQSPIEINDRATVLDSTLDALKITNFDKPVTNAEVINTGETLQVRVEDGINRTFVVEGKTYSLMQFHFHWGYHEGGSEHMINNQKYDMEAHFVFGDTDPRAVIALLFEGSWYSNRNLSPIIDVLDDIKYRSESTFLQDKLYLDKIMPKDLVNYYRYTGSLTTPLCSEDIIWTVLRQTGKVGNSQVKSLCTLYVSPKEDSNESCHMTDNIRPLQHTNGRVVKRSKYFF